MKSNRPDAGKTPGNNKPVQPKNTPGDPKEQDDPTSAQDDPDQPSEEALIPSQADLSAKESVEYFTPSGELPGELESEDDQELTEDDATPEIIPGTEADVTADDLAALGPRDEDQDDGDDENVRARDILVSERDEESDEEEDGLDVPGAEDDDEMEEIGAEDEENNDYSLDDQDDEQEDPYQDYDDR
ncbi:hypothetical protein F0L74_26595 [Chitinophaga agrisoli]|uniref:Uncharacterized protein n=1 Tax=Chitinophaga agrisoli TaxID=2607653 RepID=A0A5B2VJK0_9BACT|nr:hypothetical protein [Chitinophaga agrisoli]KAA2239763.1 hypothetical protein F0L74_26595 [Chitinophaga agrisoli]